MAPILQAPDPTRQFVGEVAASNGGVQAVISQRAAVDQRLHPCAFFSRGLSLAERNSDIGNRELLAVKMALEEWPHWLEGITTPFLVWTDHTNHTQRVWEVLRQRFWWPTMEKETWNFVNACPVCAKNKTSGQAPAGLLQLLPIPHCLSSHIVLAKWPISLLSKLPSAKKTAQLIITHVFHLHGIAVDIVSDHGPQFTACFWKEFGQQLGATVSLSSGFHPQSNAQNECLNQELETKLRGLASQSPSSWSEQLVWVEYAHDTLTNAASHISVPMSLQIPTSAVSFSRKGDCCPSALVFIHRCKRTWVRVRVIKAGAQVHQTLRDPKSHQPSSGETSNSQHN